jgi:hypothetical protein
MGKTTSKTPHLVLPARAPGRVVHRQRPAHAPGPAPKPGARPRTPSAASPDDRLPLLLEVLVALALAQLDDVVLALAARVLEVGDLLEVLLAPGGAAAGAHGHRGGREKGGGEGGETAGGLELVFFSSLSLSLFKR